MLSLEQVKHVITYYYLEMVLDYDKSIPGHIRRGCVFLNKSRGEICSDIYSNPRLRDIISKLHGAADVHQINSVPVGSICFIDKKRIPLATGGIQFIIYATSAGMEHICVQKKYQRLCYYYFKLRNFPSCTQRDILRWLNKQPWYLPKSCQINLILKRLLESNFPEKVHRDLSYVVDTLSGY